jgi:dipeptide/tripeptide permease
MTLISKKNSLTLFLALVKVWCRFSYYGLAGAGVGVGVVLVL